MNVYIFYIYRIFSRMYFHVIILFIFLYQVGFGLFYSSVLISIYGLVISFSATASSALRHRLPCKPALVFGETCKLLGVYLIIAGTEQAGVSFATVALGQALGGLGFGFCISRDTEIMTGDKSVTESGRLATILSNSQGLMFVSTFLSGFAGVVLYAHDEHLPFYASVLAGIATTLILLLFIGGTESTATADATGDGREKAAVSAAVNDGKTLFWTSYYAIVRSLSLAPFLCFLPFYFIQLMMDPYLFGILLSLYSLFAFISALRYGRLVSLFGLNATYALMTGAMILSFLLFWFTIANPGFFNELLYPLTVATALFGFGSGSVRPISLENLGLGAMSPADRVYVLSRMEILFGIINTVFIVTGASIIIVFGLGALLQFITLLMIAVTVIGWVRMNRFAGQAAEGG